MTNARNTTNLSTMGNTEFYNESKWCDGCKGYVRFLMSVNHSFCVQCGGKVRLFANDERSRVAEAAQRHRYQAV